MANPKTTEDLGSIPPAEHGKMPRWLFLIWVALVVWRIYFVFRYPVPDYKLCTKRPPLTTAEPPYFLNKNGRVVLFGDAAVCCFRGSFKIT